MENIQIAKTFEEVADLLEIEGANPFRVRAYRNAARTINTLGTPVESMLKHDGDALEQLPGIGADLAGGQDHPHLSNGSSAAARPADAQDAGEPRRAAADSGCRPEAREAHFQEAGREDAAATREGGACGSSVRVARHGEGPRAHHPARDRARQGACGPNASRRC